jgi:hypothetical protein
MPRYSAADTNEEAPAAESTGASRRDVVLGPILPSKGILGRAQRLYCDTKEREAPHRGQRGYFRLGD